MERLSKNKIKTLPKEVLDLFPIWEYQCPKCGAYLGYEPVEYCVKCGARFTPEQARVPPRFLKNYKAMSEFAHKVLAPKLTEKQRQLLFKYFTTIFEDSFESGDFSAWTGGVGGTHTVTSEKSYQGSYSAKADFGNSDNCFHYKSITATNPLWRRGYFYLDSINLGDEGDRVGFCFISKSGTALCWARIKKCKQYKTVVFGLPRFFWNYS